MRSLGPRLLTIRAGLSTCRGSAASVGSSLALVASLALCVLLLCGCDRRPTGPAAAAGASEPPIEPPAYLPEYRVAEGLREQHPEVTAFVDEFLQTCLAGDYLGYRRLVSRYVTPESRDRFRKIYHALRSVSVDSIERLDGVLPDGSPAYLVISSADFDPESKVRLRHQNRRLAILVMPEDGQWRMRPAPPELQPQEAAAPAASSGPTTSAPSYPWDVDD